jgi:hypothetical protein
MVDKTQPRIIPRQLGQYRAVKYEYAIEYVSVIACLQQRSVIRQTQVAPEPD